MAQYYTRYPRTILWLIRGDLYRPSADMAEQLAEEEVEIPSFYLSKLPITNQQLEAFDDAFTRSPNSPGDDDTALGVTFERAHAYAAWYAEVSRKPMRLPSELEWEFACRGASTEAEVASDATCWHRGNSGDRLSPLSDKQANWAGLYGMLGGAWEWTTPIDGAEGDPKGDTEGASCGVLRGGSFRESLEDISHRARWTGPGSRKLAETGFRLAKSMR